MSESVILMPRLSEVAAEHILDEASDAGSGQEALPSTGELPDAIGFAPVGGSPVSPELLMTLRNDIVEVARKAGFPGKRSVPARSRFDFACAVLLAEHPLLQSGEALRNDVWTFLATGLLRQVTLWRYDIAPERWHGGVRNTFQRLWMRARVLDRGPGAENRWEVLETLTEDAFVSIVERPSIGGDRRLALAIGEGWLRASARYGRPAMEAIMRRAVIRIRLRNEIQALSIAEPAALAAIIDEAFDKSAGD